MQENVFYQHLQLGKVSVQFIMEPMHVLPESAHTMNFTVKITPKLQRLSRQQTISMYFLGLIFVTLLALYFGVSFLMLPRSPHTKIQDYDKLCKGKRQCNLTIRIQSGLARPVQVFYELQNFITTRKNYILSRNNKQLKGKAISYKEAYQCEPYRTNKEMGVVKSWNGVDLNPNEVASPCGMQAYYYFRDTFSLSRYNQSIPIRRTGLISTFLRSQKSESTQWIDPTLDSFEIWMSSSVSSNVQKLYGIIDQDLEPGEYNLIIENFMYLDEEEVVIKNLQFTHQNSNYKRPHLFGWIILGGAVMLVGVASLALAAMKDQPFCR